MLDICTWVVLKTAEELILPSVYASLTTSILHLSNSPPQLKCRPISTLEGRTTHLKKSLAIKGLNSEQSVSVPLPQSKIRKVVHLRSILYSCSRLGL